MPGSTWPSSVTARWCCSCTGSRSSGTRGATRWRRSPTPGGGPSRWTCAATGPATSRLAGYSTYTGAEDAAKVIRSLGEDDAIVVGQGLGGVIAWSMPYLQPDVVRAVGSLSMPHPRVMRRASVRDRRQRQASRYLVELQRPFVPEREMTKDHAYVGEILRAWASPFGDYPTPDDVERYGNAMAMPFVAHSAAEHYRWFGRSQLRQDGPLFNRRIRGPITQAGAPAPGHRGRVRPGRLHDGFRGLRDAAGTRSSWSTGPATSSPRRPPTGSAPRSSTGSTPSTDCYASGPEPTRRTCLSSRAETPKRHAGERRTRSGGQPVEQPPVETGWLAPQRPGGPAAPRRASTHTPSTGRRATWRRPRRRPHRWARAAGRRCCRARPAR